MTWIDFVNQVKALTAAVLTSKGNAAAKIASLQAQLDAASTVNAEGEAALADLQAAVKGLEDL